MTLSRRQFVRTGLVGGLVLSFAGWLNAAGARALSDGEREMLFAVSGAMLDGVLPGDVGRRDALLQATVDTIALEIAALSLSTQRELGQLFGLLVSAPGRVALAGVGRPWREASGEDVGRFLQSWRGSRLALFQTAYAALHDLCFGAWYARSESWEAIGYPGPPQGVF